MSTNLHDRAAGGILKDERVTRITTEKVTDEKTQNQSTPNVRKIVTVTPESPPGILGKQPNLLLGHTARLL